MISEKAMYLLSCRPIAALGFDGDAANNSHFAEDLDAQYEVTAAYFSNLGGRICINPQLSVIMASNHPTSWERGAHAERMGGLGSALPSRRPGRYGLGPQCERQMRLPVKKRIAMSPQGPGSLRIDSPSSTEVKASEKHDVMDAASTTATRMLIGQFASKVKSSPQPHFNTTSLGLGQHDERLLGKYCESIEISSFIRQTRGRSHYFNQVTNIVRESQAQVLHHRHDGSRDHKCANH